MNAIDNFYVTKAKNKLLHTRGRYFAKKARKCPRRYRFCPSQVSSIFETFRKFPDSENLLPIRQRIVISKEQGTEHFPPGTGETN